MAIIFINGVTYAYQVSGTGEPILLLHGFTGNKSHWDALTKVLSAQYQVITVDIIGHGDTDSPPTPTRYSMHHSADDLMRLLTHLQLKQCHLLGYSMGGRLALYTAVHHPQHIRSLILESSSPGLKTDAEQQTRRDSDHALATKIETLGMDWFADFWAKLGLWESQKTLPAVILEAQHLQRKSNNPIGLANSLRGMGTGAQPSLWDALSTLNIRTTLIAGEFDTKFCTINAEMLTHLPKATFHTLPNVGHNTHLEDHDTFTNIVQTHLKG